MMVLMIFTIITPSINARDGTFITIEKESVNFTALKEATFPTLQVKEIRITNRITDENDLYKTNKKRETNGVKNCVRLQIFGLPEKIPINDQYLQVNENKIRADPENS